MNPTIPNAAASQVEPIPLYRGIAGHFALQAVDALGFATALPAGEERRELASLYREYARSARRFHARQAAGGAA